jgi:ATP-dependent Lhr-like helicase
MRDDRDEIVVVTISATDPANPFGVLIPWPIRLDETGTEPASSRSGQAPRTVGVRGATRTAGARVIIVNGRAAAWIGRGDRQLIASVPDDEPDRSTIGRAMARELVAIAQRAPEGRRGWLIEEINGSPAIEHPASLFLLQAGFASTAMGLQLRVPRRPLQLQGDDDERDA